MLPGLTKYRYLPRLQQIRIVLQGGHSTASLSGELGLSFGPSEIRATICAATSACLRGALHPVIRENNQRTLRPAVHSLPEAELLRHPGRCLESLRSSPYPAGRLRCLADMAEVRRRHRTRCSINPPC